jgi:hypothetical protein
MLAAGNPVRDRGSSLAPPLSAASPQAGAGTAVKASLPASYAVKASLPAWHAGKEALTTCVHFVRSVTSAGACGGGVTRTEVTPASVATAWAHPKH